MPPFFINKEVEAEGVPQHMIDYLQMTGWIRVTTKKLLGALSAEKMLVYEPLSQWYLAHGAVVTAVHRKITYDRKKVFEWLVEQRTAGSRTGDV